MQSIADFFAMGGYGFYVWMSMGMVLLLMLFEPITLKLKHRRLLAQIKRRNRQAAAREEYLS